MPADPSHPRSGHGVERIPPAAPIISTFTLGPWQTNCYVVQPGPPGGLRTAVEAGADPATSGRTSPTPHPADGERDCWIVDASFGPGPIVEHVRRAGLRPMALILTHAHVDHIAGVAEVVAAFPGPPRLPVWIHAAERDWLNDPELNLSMFTGQPVTAPGPDRLLADGDELSLGGTRWRVLHTPGHSPGGIALASHDAPVVLAGDALFAGSIGRTDFPGSSFEQLERSIRAKLYTLPDGTAVYPGHGPSTTIGRERASNPFVV